MAKRKLSIGRDARDIRAIERRAGEGKTTSYTPVVQPLPVWSHPEFNAFVDSYTAYVDHRLAYYRLASKLSDDDVVINQLRHWEAVKKSIHQLRWMGTRLNAR